MATFTANKLYLTQINGGQEYEQGDFLQSDTINDVVEGTAYAQNVAEAANTKSDEAVSTANSANSTANAASAKVDKFDERITKAQNTADTAVSNAATAQSTADSATTEINKIKNGTTVVPNANHANNADNANMATKAQQDVNGNPINTTYATKEFVTEQQGTRVKVNNVNVAELSFTSDPQTQLNSKANQNGSYKTLSAGALIVDDTRSVNSPPSYYYGKGSKVTSEFKNCSTVGLPSDETYCTLVTVCPWTDDSGGAIAQTAFVGNTKYTRQSTSDTAWSDWLENNFAQQNGEYPDLSVGHVLENENNSILLAKTKYQQEYEYDGYLGYNFVVRGSAHGRGNVIIGGFRSASSHGISNVCIGENKEVYGGGNVSLGTGGTIGSSSTPCSSCIAIHGYVYRGDNSIAIGFKSKAYDGSCAIGAYATTGETSNIIQLGASNLSALRCAVGLTVTSDERDKIDILPIANALTFIKKITPITYLRNDRSNYVSNEDRNSETFAKYRLCDYDKLAHAQGTKKGERRRSGFSAQQILNAIEEVYGTDNFADIVNDNFYDYTEKPIGVENQYTVSYQSIIPFLVGAIQELSCKIDVLETKIAELEKLHK